MAIHSIVADAFHRRATSVTTSPPSTAASEGLAVHIDSLSKELLTRLSGSELEALLDFLSYRSSFFKDKDRSISTTQLEHLWAAFALKETTCSGQSYEDLTSPSGPLEAEVGVILHVLHRRPQDTNLTQCKKQFWNPQSASIKVLLNKGFSSDKTGTIELP